MDEESDDIDGVDGEEALDPAETAKRLLDGYVEDLESTTPLHAAVRTTLDDDHATHVAACLDATGITLAIVNGSPDAVLAWAWFDAGNPQHRGALRSLRGAIDQALEQDRSRA